jgi:hypothetical protein
LKKILPFIIIILLSSSLVYALEEYSGTYLDYKYYYTYKDGQYAFIFSSKPLPRDDVTVIGAMYKAIKDIDGKLSLEDTTPKIKRNSKGAGIIYFIGKKAIYNFLMAQFMDLRCGKNINKKSKIIYQKIKEWYC